MRRATVYRREGLHIVHASSKTTDGLWILSEPIVSVREEEGLAELGRKVLSALDGSRSGVAHPHEWKAVLAPLLTISGVKTWAAFCKFAACVEVEEQNGRIALVPTRNLGAQSGFEPEVSEQVFTTRDDPAQVGTLTSVLL